MEETACRTDYRGVQRCSQERGPTAPAGQLFGKAPDLLCFRLTWKRCHTRQSQTDTPEPGGLPWLFHCYCLKSNYQATFLEGAVRNPEVLPHLLCWQANRKLQQRVCSFILSPHWFTHLRATVVA